MRVLMHVYARHNPRCDTQVVAPCRKPDHHHALLRERERERESEGRRGRAGEREEKRDGGTE